LFRLGKQLKLEAGGAQLLFSNNALSTLTISTTLANRLRAGTASDLFASAVMSVNVISEPNNLFVAGLLSFSGNALLASPQGASYGVMAANRATANGNVATLLGDQAILFFATPATGGFAEAGNQVFIQN
jgi:hypothetical protein